MEEGKGQRTLVVSRAREVGSLDVGGRLDLSLEPNKEEDGGVKNSRVSGGDRPRALHLIRFIAQDEARGLVERRSDSLTGKKKSRVSKELVSLKEKTNP